MNLRLKANLIVVPVAVVLVALGAVSLDHAARRAALDHARSEASLLTAEADAAARYTQEKVAPLLANGPQARLVFVPPSVPFYAVEAQAHMIEAANPDDTLRRVVLDPVNDADRPDDWERAAIDKLRADPDPQPYTEERPDHRLTLITPLRFAPGICATCYTSRAAAPGGIVDAFGAAQGFDRKPGEIVGVTVATVKLAEAGSGGIGWLIGLAVVLIVLFNGVLEVLVFRPLARLSAAAEDISLGKPGVAEFGPEFGTRRVDEIGLVTRSFTRLRRSMESAIGLIDT